LVNRQSGKAVRPIISERLEIVDVQAEKIPVKKMEKHIRHARTLLPARTGSFQEMKS
jgi:hypothetical protein